MAKIVALLSGGIDSPAAVGLALEQGMDVVAVHCRTQEVDKRAEEKAIELARQLQKRTGGKIRLFVVPFERALAEIVQNCGRHFACVMCKRMMSRIAEKIAIEEKADAILKGDSLGQVASQTLGNINAEAGTIFLPVIRPLLAMDKLEIEAIAKRLGTFGISILPSACCSVPDKPATNAKRQAIEEMEKNLPVAEIVEEAVGAKREIRL